MSHRIATHTQQQLISIPRQHSCHVSSAEVCKYLEATVWIYRTNSIINTVYIAQTYRDISNIIFTEKHLEQFNHQQQARGCSVGSYLHKSVVKIKSKHYLLCNQLITQAESCVIIIQGEGGSMQGLMLQSLDFQYKPRLVHTKLSGNNRLHR